MDWGTLVSSIVIMGAMATVFSTLLSMITIPFVVMLGAKLLQI